MMEKYYEHAELISQLPLHERAPTVTVVLCAIL